MNCYLHPETSAAAFCRTCGRPLCTLCQRTADGTVFCQDHLPPSAYAGQAGSYAPPPDPGAAGANPYFQAAPYSAAPRVQTSPALAFILGWIPGVGAIYNGQYLKGLVHAIIFGLIISFLNSSHETSGEPLLVMTLVAFIFYMAFEAFHTAKKRQMGVPVEEWSSLMGQQRHRSRAPIGPILLIVIGVLFLLDTLNLIRFSEVGRFWPVLLICVGAYMLYTRVTAGEYKGAPDRYTAPGSYPAAAGYSASDPSAQAPRSSDYGEPRP